MATKNPTTVTIYGRLSFPVFKYADAVVRNQKSDYPKADTTQVTPEFNLLVEQAQLDKLVAHVRDVFLPFCEAQAAANEKRNALTPAETKRILKVIDGGDWADQPPYLPIKMVPEKTQALAPEAVAMIKILGNRGTDIEQKAIVTSEDELLVPDPALLVYPVIKPIGQTVHQLYAGCYTAATLNLYSFVSGKLPGFSASAGVAIFKADGDRFGGGSAVDEDEIFAD